MTNGPFVRVSVGGKGMGQLAPAPRGRARLDLEVDAAPWVDVRRIELFINGSRRGKPIDVPPSSKVQRYKGSIDLRVERDAYVVVVVRGDALGPVLPGGANQSPPTALAITNPDLPRPRRRRTLVAPQRRRARRPSPGSAGRRPTAADQAGRRRSSLGGGQLRRQNEPPPMAAQVPDGAHCELMVQRKGAQKRTLGASAGVTSKPRPPTWFGRLAVEQRIAVAQEGRVAAAQAGVGWPARRRVVGRARGRRRAVARGRARRAAQPAGAVRIAAARQAARAVGLPVGRGAGVAVVAADVGEAALLPCVGSAGDVPPAASVGNSRHDRPARQSPAPLHDGRQSARRHTSSVTPPSPSPGT